MRVALAIQRSLAELNRKPCCALGRSGYNKKARAKRGVTGASLTHLPMQWLPT
jgi:hypothetical protein